MPDTTPTDPANNQPAAGGNNPIPMNNAAPVNMGSMPMGAQSMPVQPMPVAPVAPQPQIPAIQPEAVPVQPVPAPVAPQAVPQPVVPQQPQAVAPAPAAPPQVTKNQGTGKPSVLVVEDEKDALDLYMYSIQSTGDFDVYGAMDGDEALMQLTQNKVDLVLLDIMMPKKDGVETLAELKRNSPVYGSPKVVMLTNIGGDIAIDKAMSLGADGYMLKSEIEPMELIGIIKQYLNLA